MNKRAKERTNERRKRMNEGMFLQAYALDDERTILELAKISARVSLAEILTRERERERTRALTVYRFDDDKTLAFSTC